MKIGFLLIHLGGGGAERVATEIAAQLEEHEIIFFVLEKEARYATDREVVTLDVPVVTSSSKRTRLRSFARAIVLLRRLKRQHGLDVMVSFLAIPNVLNVMSGGERTLLTVHSDDSIQLSGSLFADLFRNLARGVYRRADAVLAVSRGTARDVVERFDVPEEMVHVVHNPLWRSRVAEMAAAPVEPEIEQFLAGPSIVTMGRLSPPKGQWHLLRVVAELKRRGTSVRLALVGSGELEAYLRELATQLGLRVSGPQVDPTSDVAFLGFRDNPFAVIRHARLFVLPSLWEGFGNVILEALEVGLPVVAADCPSGPREILAPELAPDAPPVERPTTTRYGVLMPRLDGERRPANEPLAVSEDVWAASLAELLADEELVRLQGPGRERAGEFDIELIADRWRELLSTVASDGRHREPSRRSRR